MSSGLTTWWATPVRPASHFSAAELDRSERYHRPLRLAGVCAVLARLVLLVLFSLAVGWLVAGRSVIDDVAIDRSRTLAGAGWLDVLGNGSLWLGAGLSALALRLPAVAVDTWFEYRFSRRLPTPPSEREPGSSALLPVDEAPIRPDRFLVTVTALLVVTWVALVLVGGVGYRLAASSERWPLLVAVLVVTVLLVATALEHPVRVRLPGAPRPMTPRPDGPAGRFAELAAKFHLVDLGFHLVDPASAVRSGAGAGPLNAHAAGVGRHRRVVVTEGLLAEPVPVRDFVVAHELSHVARRHVLVQTVLSGAVVVLIIQVLGALARTGQPWNTFGLEPLDPAAMPATVLVLLLLAGVAGPVVSWVARHQERVADGDAISVLGPLGSDQARRLLGDTTSDLSPPWWIRLFAHHPTPTERLEFMARHRR